MPEKTELDFLRELEQDVQRLQKADGVTSASSEDSARIRSKLNARIIELLEAKDAKWDYRLNTGARETEDAKDATKD